MYIEINAEVLSIVHFLEQELNDITTQITVIYLKMDQELGKYTKSEGTWEWISDFVWIMICWIS